MEYQINENNHHCQINLSGKLVFTDHNKFKEIIEHAAKTDIQSVSLDFGEVTFIDSAGIGMVLLLRDGCEKNNKKLSIKRLQGQAKKVFDIAKLEHLFHIEHAS